MKDVYGLVIVNVNMVTSIIVPIEMEIKIIIHEHAYMVAVRKVAFPKM